MEEDVNLLCNEGDLADSLHAQAQAPDDPFHDQDSHYASRDSFYPSPFYSQVARLPTNRYFHSLLFQLSSQDNTHLPPPGNHTKFSLSQGFSPWFMFYSYGFDLSDRI
jgi:hypothetical protein